MVIEKTEPISHEDRQQPLVTVLVPSFNHQRFITRCITSIVKQTYKNYELIVVDDGSTDESLEILKELQVKFGFVLISQANRGLPATLNWVITEVARGKYISVCASDDFWVSNKLQLQVEFMEAHPEMPMCYGKAYVVDEENKVNETLTAEKNRNLRGGSIFKNVLLMDFHPPVSYMYRIEVFEKVGCFKESILTEDFYMNLKISNQFAVGYIDEYLIYYRAATNYHRKFQSTVSALAHLDCINEYKLSPHYKEALARWNFRTFIWYSAYSKHKCFAARAMLRSTRYLFSLGYIKATVKLIFFWR